MRVCRYFYASCRHSFEHCSCFACRRKLEDVSSKLEILYRKLGEQVLSPATLQGLHTILQHIWQYDYQSCLQVQYRTSRVSMNN